MNIGASIIVAAALLAAAFAVSHRYTVLAIGGDHDYTSMWRVDQWTGRVLLCDFGTGFTQTSCTEPKWE